jgi:hypothetical protein
VKFIWINFKNSVRTPQKVPSVSYYRLSLKVSERIIVSSCTTVVGSAQPLTEMGTRNLPGGKGRPTRKADNLAAICEPIAYKMWKPRRATTLWASTACYKDSFTFLHVILKATLYHSPKD